MALGMNLVSALAPQLFGIIDSVIPDPQAREQVKANLSVKLMEHNGEMTQAASNVVSQEIQGESWLQRNWRPGLMVWFAFLLGMYWFGYIPENMSEEAVSGLFTLIQIGVGGYVVGRSAEKVAERVGSRVQVPRTTG